MSTFVKDSTPQQASVTAGICLSTSLHHEFHSMKCWIVDSGASRHVRSNAANFISIRPIQHATVVLPNQTYLPVHYCGDVKLNTHMILKDVLLCPDFHYNLLSVSALTSISNLTVTFFPHEFIIQDATNWRMIGKGDRSRGLYILNADTSFMPTIDKNIQGHCSASVRQDSAFVNKVTAHTWHHRLGHISPQVFELLRHQLQCESLKWNTANPCYICPLAKQKRLPFVSHNKLSKLPFDLIHCDIWGPYHIPTHAGHQCFLTLVEDYTRFTWVFLLKHKSDVNIIIPYFFNMISTQFNCSIKSLRSDNAKELALTEFLNNKGVIHQLSCVERPEQKSVVEQKHQHLLNVARALYSNLRHLSNFGVNVCSQLPLLSTELLLYCCTTVLHLNFCTKPRLIIIHSKPLVALPLPQPYKLIK